MDEWQTEWDVVRPLGAGGQGTAFLVRHRGRGTIGVLKTLKNPTDQKARRRLKAEANNLRLLHAAGCSVPALLDHNTEAFEDSGTLLYIIMEYIEGDTLTQYVEKAGHLSMDDALRVALALCDFCKGANAEQVIHRDLWPNNIMVTPERRVMVIDLGVSYNREAGEQVTSAGERFDTKFLSLPERRVGGGDRRDERSDVTGIVGILFFCLTGLAPVDLMDEAGRPPHRREGGVVSVLHAGDPRVAGVEMLLDQGFRVLIEERFQDVSTLEARIRGLLSGSIKYAGVDPRMVARAHRGDYLKRDERTQRKRFGDGARKIVERLKDYVGGLRGSMIPYVCQAQVLESEVITRVSKWPAGLLPLCSIAVRTWHQDRDWAYWCILAVGASGDRCGIWWMLCRGNLRSPREVVLDWAPIQDYPGEGEPSSNLFVDVIQSGIVESIDRIRTEILGSGR